MKLFKVFCLFAFIVLSVSASAQFVNMSHPSSEHNVWTTVHTNKYNRIYVSYLPSKLKVDVLDIKLKGFQVGYLRGIGLTKKVPLYLEVGGAFQLRKYNESVTGINEKVTASSLNVPIALTYRINIDEAIAISPTFAFDFRVNLSGDYKIEFDDEEVKMDLFKDLNCKRFQAGWHIGIGFDYKVLHLGVNYGTDFNEILTGCKVATTSVTVGWNF